MSKEQPQEGVGAGVCAAAGRHPNQNPDGTWGAGHHAMEYVPIPKPLGPATEDMEGRMVTAALWGLAYNNHWNPIRAKTSDLACKRVSGRKVRAVLRELERAGVIEILDQGRRGRGRMIRVFNPEGEEWGTGRGRRLQAGDSREYALPHKVACVVPAGPCVYMIAGGGRLKIGLSDDPIARVAAMQTGSPVPLELVACMSGGSMLESELHARFDRLRVYGEWFEDAAEIREAFKAGEA